MLGFKLPSFPPPVGGREGVHERQPGCGGSVGRLRRRPLRHRRPSPPPEAVRGHPRATDAIPTLRGVEADFGSPPPPTFYLLCTLLCFAL